MASIVDENKMLKEHNIQMIDFYQTMVLTKLPMRIGEDFTLVECMISKETANRLEKLSNQMKEAIEKKKKEDENNESITKECVEISNQEIN